MFYTYTSVLYNYSRRRIATRPELASSLLAPAKEDKLIFAENLSQGGQKLYSILMYVFR